MPAFLNSCNPKTAAKPIPVRIKTAYQAIVKLPNSKILGLYGAFCPAVAHTNRIVKIRVKLSRMTTPGFFS